MRHLRYVTWSACHKAGGGSSRTASRCQKGGPRGQQRPYRRTMVKRFAVRSDTGIVKAIVHILMST